MNRDRQFPASQRARPGLRGDQAGLPPDARQFLAISEEVLGQPSHAREILIADSNRLASEDGSTGKARVPPHCCVVVLLNKPRSTKPHR